MSKVLIDRALLERVQERLDPHRDAVLWGDVCDTLRSAPSDTPAMPVKAYYHEAPNEYGGLNKSVGLEVRKAFTDAPLVLEAEALARIACLEGEIAKRDARILGLESQYQRDVYGLNNEGDPIGGDPAGGYANDNARLRAELSALKAQGVVMPERWNVQRPMWKDARQPYGNPLNHADIEAAEKFNLALDEVARLNADPVQQVSVPDGWRELAERADDFLYSLPETDGVLRLRADLCSMLSAPAAPAADAGIVDMYRHLQKVTPYRFKKIQDASITDGGDVMYFHKDRFDAALLDDIAAHRAKGVV